MATGPCFRLALAAAALALSGCDERETGPVRVSAIGDAAATEEPQSPAARPALRLPRRGGRPGPRPLRQCRRDRAGAGAKLDRLRRRHALHLPHPPRAMGRTAAPVTAEQVAARLRAAASRASRNPLKPVLGAIEDVVAMTDQVLEISLRGPRPNMLQLLAQPEMGIIDARCRHRPACRRRRGRRRGPPLPAGRRGARKPARRRRPTSCCAARPRGSPSPALPRARPTW